MRVVADDRADQILLHPDLPLRIRNRLCRLLHQLFGLSNVEQARRPAVNKVWVSVSDSRREARVCLESSSSASSSRIWK